MNGLYPVLLLSDWIRRFLGVSAPPGANLEGARLDLAGGGLGWIVALLLVGGAVWFGWLYAQEGARPQTLMKALLASLRLFALFSLAMLLLQPVLRAVSVEKIKPVLALVFDRSASMDRRDARLPQALRDALQKKLGVDPTSLSRGDLAERMFTAGQPGLLAELSKRFEVRAYGFAADIHPQPSLSARTAPPSERTSTQTGAAIRRVAEDLRGTRTAGMLLLTDGGNNLGPDPVAAAGEAARLGTPVHAVGIGDPTPTRDIAVTDILADRIVRKGNLAQIHAGVSQRGFTGKSVALRLFRGGKLVQEKRAKLGRETDKSSVTFEWTPSQPGDFGFRVEAVPLAGELTVKNNARRFLQRVIDKQLRVLLVDGDPRWEYRYLRNAILRDKQIRFSCFVTSVGTRLGGEGNVPIRAFPMNAKTLFTYDILILGDVPRSYFSEAQLRAIREFVEEKGGSLVVIAGERHMPDDYRGSPLEAVFPVSLSGGREQVNELEGFRWELTAAGRRDPLMRMDPDPAKNERIWRELPGMFWHSGAERAKPGATVLAVNSKRSNAHGKRVLVAVQPFGAGRCLISLADSTWLWRYRVGDKWFYRYWGQAIRAMTPRDNPGGNQFAQIATDRAEVTLGERVLLRARLLDAYNRPLKAISVAARVTGEIGGARTVLLRSSAGAPGVFEGYVSAERPGEFTAEVASPHAPTKRASVKYLVQVTDLENARPELNERLLRSVVAAGKGHYMNLAGLDAWAAALHAEPEIVRRNVEAELWDAPALLACFVLALTLEWILRKRSGLL